MMAKAKKNHEDDTVAKAKTTGTEKKKIGKKDSGKAKAEPKVKAKKKAAGKPKAEPEPKAKKKAAGKAKAEPEPKPKKKVAGKPKAEPKPKPEPKPEPKVKKKAADEPKAQAEPKPKKAAKPEPQAKAKPEPKPKASEKAQAKAKAKAQAKAKKAEAKKKARKGKKGAAGQRTRADESDRHLLYQLSVQSPQADIEFFVDRYHDLRGRDPQVLREDFCGTALISATWAASGDDRRAVGVDLDATTLQWGREHNLAAVPEEAQARVELRQANVLDGGGEPADVTCAMNFSYGVFKTRAELRHYLEVVHQQLADDGMFVTELYGGTEAIVEVKDEREIEDETGAVEGFTYEWEQASYNPITHETLCHIHFAFPDDSRIERAFTYDWRLWSIAEVRELLYEVGFSSVRVYWEATDDDGDGTGEYYPTEKEDNQESWLVYIVAAK